MPVIIRIAFRNLVEHKVKSLIIGTIIILGVIIIIVGNSLIDTAALGIQRSFIDNYTGHLIITGVADGDVSIFGVEGAMGRDSIPVIPEYAKVREYVDSRKEISAVTSQITAFGSIRLNEYDERSFTMLFGIEAETYQTAFDNLKLIEGQFLKPGEEGIILSRYRIDNLVSRIKEQEGKRRKQEGIKEEDIKVDIKVGDPIVITCMSNIGIKIREVPLAGIVEFKNEAEEQKFFSFIDAQTIRALLGMTISTKNEIQLDDQETTLLTADDPDALFGNFETIQDAGSGTEQLKHTEESLLNILNTQDKSATGSPGNSGEIIEEKAPELDTGAWHFILIKLHNMHTSARVIKDLNNRFIDQGIEAVAGNWEKAAGPFVTTADVVRVIFNIAIIILGIVAIIIIITTLLISVIERTSEIGTMRALGAKKSFVWKLFITETLILVLVFGVLGVLLSGLIVLIINMIGIEATNTFVKILFAGPVLKPQISIASIFLSLGIVIVFGILAHVIPVLIALEIRPVQAIQKE